MRYNAEVQCRSQRYIALMMAPKYSSQELGMIRFQEISREEPRRPQPESGQIMQKAAQRNKQQEIGKLLVRYYDALGRHSREEHPQTGSIPLELRI